MKNRLIILSVIWLFILSTGCFSATKEQVINSLYTTYPVGETTYRLPDRIVEKAVKFLNKKELTSEQYDVLLSAASKVATLADKAGTTNVKEMQQEDVLEGLGALVEVSEAIDVDLEKELAENNMTLNSFVETIENGEEPVEEKEVEENPNIEIHEDESKPNTETNLIEEVTSNEENNEKDNKNELEITTPHESADTSEGLLEYLLKRDGEELKGWKKMIASMEGSLRQIKQETKWTFAEFWEHYFKIFVIVIGVILFLLFFIIILLFKAKWNKIIKWAVTILLVLVFVSLLASFVVMLVYLREIKAVFKLYYIFT